MNRHIDKAMQLRNETPMVSNCAQTIMRAYADELGMTEQQAAAIGIDSPAVITEFRKRIAANHDGLTDCVDLLRNNARKGGVKKEHCDNMIKESIELIDEITNKED